VRGAGRPRAPRRTASPRTTLARAALALLLLSAALPILALAFPAADGASGGPAVVALSGALEKAHRWLQGDGRAALDPVCPSRPPEAHGLLVAFADAAPSPAPAAPSPLPGATAGPVDASRRL
jgi:hypothetical protein